MARRARVKAMADDAAEPHKTVILRSAALVIATALNIELQEVEGLSW